MGNTVQNLAFVVKHVTESYKKYRIDVSLSPIELIGEKECFVRCIKIQGEVKIFSRPEFSFLFPKRHHQGRRSLLSVQNIDPLVRFSGGYFVISQNKSADFAVNIQTNVCFPTEDAANRIEPIDALPELDNTILVPHKFSLKRRNKDSVLGKHRCKFNNFFFLSADMAIHHFKKPRVSFHSTTLSSLILGVEQALLKFHFSTPENTNSEQALLKFHFSTPENTNSEQALLKFHFSTPENTNSVFQS
ncbi:Uncharacterized protein dnm_031430 [Desulfonema magnum]|uniref:Uncharacterized protein n=1 Tax=Desulfonema magnum TaxID=45655 RepID=A0A975BL51_9BACT|nr:Uncharacterized protein dnm_031430 [Desulfonema magnum]